MPLVNSREDLKNYCLRKLGAPVIQIDVAEEQIQDRINDAFEYWHDFHYDGVDRYYFKKQITQDDINQQYINIEDPLIISVTNMFSFSSANINMFDIRYQIRLNDFYDFNNVSMIHYQITRQHLALLDFLFNQEPTIRFNRNENRIYMDLSWTQDVTIGDYYIFECYRATDPETWTTIYNDRMLKFYATALIKEQWGSNLKKFGNVQLTGGVTLNGQQIYEEGREEADQLRKEMMAAYQLPIDFFMG